MKTLLLSLMFMFSAHAQTILMHDVSILFPKPKKPVSETSLTVHTTGKLGSLIPESAFSKLPRLEPSFQQQTQSERLEVMAIRIDPPEVRLVWGVFQDFAQYDEAPRILALDTAVHTFYKLENPQAFMSELQKISLLSRTEVNVSLPLGVHPTLQKEGMSGAYAVALKKLLLDSIGEKNLTKMTFMAVSAVHLRWDFGGFLMMNGKPAALKIVKLGNTKLQTYVNDTFPPNAFSGGIEPAPKAQDAFNRFVANSMRYTSRDEKDLTDSHSVAVRVENPQLETSDTIDCVSCHVAQQVRYMTEATHTPLRESMANRYVNAAFNLQNKSAARMRTDNVHAFGWFSDGATVNQRTINETSYVTERLNRSLNLR